MDPVNRIGTAVPVPYKTNLLKFIFIFRYR